MNRQSTGAQLDPKSFEAIAGLVYRECGLQLVAEKSSMIQSRLRHRLKAVGAQSFDAYAALVCSNQGQAERIEMISALTTNVSHFFREKHHFDILENEILPKAINSPKSGRRFRIWSAGCSNGQEPYSIALSALQVNPDISGTDFKILATDIDPKVVRFAAEGRYPSRLTNGIPQHLLSQYFEKPPVQDEDIYIARPQLKSLVVFKELNLLSPWPIGGVFDVIFCRNVVIYFDTAMQNKLWPRFNEVLSNDGRLFLGHSERIPDPVKFGYRNIGPTAYQKATAQNTRPNKGNSNVP